MAVAAMSINYSNQIIADVRCTGLNLLRGLGTYLLQFSLSFDVKAWADKQLHFKNASIKVLAGTSAASQLVVGFAVPELPVTLTTRTFAASQNYLFELAATSQQITALEETRNGGDLSFTLHLHGESYGDGDPLPTQDDIRYVARQSEWISLLNQAEFSNVLLFEIELPIIGMGEHLNSAVKHLKNAQDWSVARASVFVPPGGTPPDKSAVIGVVVMVAIIVLRLPWAV
jgi:hypothetical protein